MKCGDDGVGRAFCECKLRWERVVGLIRFNEWGTQDLKIFFAEEWGRKEWQVAPWRDRTHYGREGERWEW